MSAVTIWYCDRCGNNSEGGGPDRPPPKWTKVETRRGSGYIGGVLCDGCGGDFRDWWANT